MAEGLHTSSETARRFAFSIGSNLPSSDGSQLMAELIVSMSLQLGDDGNKYCKQVTYRIVQRTFSNVPPFCSFFY